MSEADYPLSGAVISVLVKMSSRKAGKTLAQKLVKSGRVEKLSSQAPNATAGAVPDIEDAVGKFHGRAKSQYFSPMQTRSQSKVNANLPRKLEPDDERARQVAVESRKPIRNSKSSAETKVPRSEKQSAGSEIENTASESASKEQPAWEPLHWHQVLQNIRTMRAGRGAPVDTMGCHKCADENADDKTRRFQKLVALMLSSQTKDETTFETMKKLKLHTLTPDSIASMKTTQLEDILHSVSFYKNKAKYLQQTSRILIDRYEHDIPNNIGELVALPGVGPKMAHICMAIAWDEVTGIGVDTHVHRIVNRLRWVKRETKDPEGTRVALEQWLPRDLWREVNHLLVGFGQTICTPVRPKCGICLNSSICPAATKSSALGKDMGEDASNADSKQLNAILKSSTLKKRKIQA